MLIDELVAKRKKLFEIDPDKDRLFIEYSARKILKDRDAISAIRDKPWLLIEAIFTVVDKKRRSIPFFLNTVQKEFLSAFEKYRTDRPYFILKGRQQGFTTLITALQLCYAITRRNFSGFTVADCSDNVNSIFNDKAKVVYNALPDIVKPHEKYNSKKELFFDKLNSSWRIATAGGDAGRSRTLEFAHFSEVAFYEASISDMQKSVGEALTANAVVIYETTANGWNEAKDLWDSKSCVNLFFEWWKSDEYRRDECVDLSKIEDSWLIERIRWLKNKKGLDDSQIAWYIRKYDSYLDKNSIKQEYPCMPEEAFIASGECVFDKDKIIKRLCEISDKGERLDFVYNVVKGEYCQFLSDIRINYDSSGAITIYEKPNIGDSYVIGCDTAGSGDDYFTAVVERVRDAKTVAIYKVKRIDEDLYAKQLYCLGKYYNFALIAVEVNFSVCPVRELIALDYPELYKRAEGIDGIGFKTTQITRPIILNGLKMAFREDPKMECSKEILGEMLSFIRNKSGREEAAVGKHDDLVMAKAIAHYLRDEYGNTPIAQQTESFIDSNFSFTVNNNKKIEW